MKDDLNPIHWKDKNYKRSSRNEGKIELLANIKWRKLQYIGHHMVKKKYKLLDLFWKEELMQNDQFNLKHSSVARFPFIDIFQVNVWCPVQKTFIKIANFRWWYAIKENVILILRTCSRIIFLLIVHSPTRNNDESKIFWEYKFIRMY